MKRFFFKINFLFVIINVATSKKFDNEEFSRKDLDQIQKILQDVQIHGSDTKQGVRYVHPHHHKINNEHDHTNIQTLNLVFKHNNIGRSKPIARTGEREERTAAVDGTCLLGRCGCGGKSSRCGCGRAGDPCDVNHDYSKANVYYLNNNYNDDYASDDRKNRATNDANIEKFLNDLENILSKDKQDGLASDPKLGCNGPNCRPISWDYSDYNDNKNDKADKNVIKFLDDLENALTTGKNVNDVIDNERDDDDDDDDDDDSDDNTYLRCFKRCGKGKSYRSTNEEDDKAYLRCCKRCGKSKYFRTINVESNENNKEDDREYLRCCKKTCGKSRYTRISEADPFKDEGHRDYLRCCRNCARSNDQEPVYDGLHNRAAKIYQINDDLDAIVIDVSDIDNILKLVNNGNNFDNGNAIRDYIRSSHAKLVPKRDTPEQQKRKSRLLPMTLQQKLKSKNRKRYNIRRNQKPDVEKNGLPFELDVQGLGQVNP